MVPAAVEKDFAKLADSVQQTAALLAVLTENAEVSENRGPIIYQGYYNNVTLKRNYNRVPKIGDPNIVP